MCGRITVKVRVDNRCQIPARLGCGGAHAPEVHTIAFGVRVRKACWPAGYDIQLHSLVCHMRLQ